VLSVALDGAQLTVLRKPVNAERLRAELQRRLSTSAAV
jgi:hypothetical protein